MSTKINPVAGYILVEPQKKEQTTNSGIILPSGHEEKPQQGTVLAVGASIYNDGREILSPVKVGDVVVYKEWGGKEYKENNVDLLILKFDDIMAIIK
ncbi:MAG: co-chaperone GroES [Candidatus Shapirobacteria bacterium]